MEHRTDKIHDVRCITNAAIVELQVHPAKQVTGEQRFAAHGAHTEPVALTLQPRKIRFELKDLGEKL
jgi:hypothetical protein